MIFLGTSLFALPILRALHRDGHDIAAVITQPDRPAGRGLKISEPPIKILAQQLGLHLEQPATLEDPKFQQVLKTLNPEIMVVVSYGLKLPAEVLDIPRYGCLNLHPSLLPKYRGAAPINWAIINGEAETGVTVIKMNSRMDAGDIVLQERVTIDPEENAGELEARLSELGAGMMVRAVEMMGAGVARLAAQDETKATKAPKLKSKDCQIDWRRGGREIRNLVRGLFPRPGARTRFRGKILEIAEVGLAEISIIDEGGKPGMVVASDPEEGLLVMTADEALSIKRLKPEGKRLMTGSEFVRGYRPTLGELLG